MTEKAMNEMCQLLKAGQVVEIDGNFFRAIHLDEMEAATPCHYCTLDSVCSESIADVCYHLDVYPNYGWILKLASEH